MVTVCHHFSDTLNRQLDRQRQKLNDHQDGVQRLRVTVNELKEEKLKIDSELQQRTKLEESKMTLVSDNETLQGEVEVGDQLNLTPSGLDL